MLFITLLMFIIYKMVYLKVYNVPNGTLKNMNYTKCNNKNLLDVQNSTFKINFILILIYFNLYCLNF
jgi:hypothetical protein